MKIDYLKKQFFKYISLIFIFCLFELDVALAQTLDSSFFYWKIYEMNDDDSDFKKCYIVNSPFKTDSSDPARKKPFMMVTRFQKDRIEEVSIYGGFEFKINGPILMLIDEQQFLLKSNIDYAWSRSRSDDIRIIEKLLESTEVKIRSDSNVGNYAVDFYNLKGIAKAFKRMREICR